MLQITDRQMMHLALTYYSAWKDYKYAKNRIRGNTGENEISALNDALTLRIQSAKLEAMMEMFNNMHCVVKWDNAINKPVLVDISADDDEAFMLHLQFHNKVLCYEEEDQ